jgi:hypothetical protein
MPDSYDKRFSEDTYATKEDVAEVFNVTSADFIWNQVVSYRKRLTTTLELPNIDRTKFSLVYTQSINNRILSFERLLNKAYFGYNGLSDFGKKAFKEKRLIKILGGISSAKGIKLSDSFLLTMLDNSVSAIPNEAVVIDNYYLALRYLETHDAGNITYTDFNGLYEILSSGSEPVAPLKEKTWRQTVLEEPHYYQRGYIYKAALVERIDEMMDSLCSFMSDENIYAAVRAISALFYVGYIQPYELFREDMQALAFKLALSRTGFGLFASFLNIEGLVFFKDEKLQQASDNVQKYFDLTYWFDYVLKYLSTDLAEIMDDLASAQKDEVEFEAKSIGFSNAEKEQFKRESEPENLGIPSAGVQVSLFPDEGEEKKAAPAAPAASPIPSSEAPSASVPAPSVPAVSPSPAPSISPASRPIYGNVDVALPVFPSGFGPEDVDRVTIDLLETYPTLRKTQAHFYASHCTVGRSYTIQEFKTSEDTSYETARTSMDYLAEMGFYEKAKIRNKFVYRPIPRR